MLHKLKLSKARFTKNLAPKNSSIKMIEIYEYKQDEIYEKYSCLFTEEIDTTRLCVTAEDYIDIVNTVFF